MREASTHKIYFSTPFADISLLGVICTRLSLWPFLWCRMCFPTEQTLEQFHRSEVPNFIFIFLLRRCCWQWHSNHSRPCTRTQVVYTVTAYSKVPIYENLGPRFVSFPSLSPYLASLLTPLAVFQCWTNTSRHLGPGANISLLRHRVRHSLVSPVGF